MLKYEVVIIGGGSSGVEAALYAKSQGMKVAIIEKNRWGGRKVHAGLFKAKQLQKCSNIALNFREASKNGFDISSFEVDFPRLQNKIFSNAMTHASRIYSQLKSAGIDCFMGEASIDENKLIQVENQAIRTENIIIATGSKE
ncbi:MAG TPA: FAD-dependent oxidoreductase, partial [Kurthia sp.]